MRSLKFLAAAVLLAGAVTPCFSQDAEPMSAADRAFIQNIQFLCKWARTNAPQGNPVAIRVCAPGAAADATQAEEDSGNWWKHWRETDNETWERLAPAFDAALQEYATREERAAAADAKRLKAARTKAAHDKLVDSLPTMPIQELCALYRKGTVPEAFSQIAGRKDFSAEEISLIRSQSIELGMSEGTMLCAFGYPEDSHRTVGSWGVHTQHVYGHGLYIYVENGKVTSWQD